STELCAPAGAASYFWSTGETTQCITVSEGDVYSVTVTDAAGCSSTCQETVIVNKGPVCTITGGKAICEGSSTELCAPAGAASYFWSTGETTQCITVSEGDVYSVTVTDAAGCSSTCQETVIVNKGPVCTINGVKTICEGSSTELCVDGDKDSSYLWSNGETTSCITVNTAGTYSVTVTSADGCTSTCDVEVIVNKLPACTIGVALSCLENATQICAPAGAASYLWNTGETTACITITTSGTYSVTATNDGGCSSTCSIPVTVAAPPECIILGEATICEGETTTLCGTPGASSYLWSTGENTECIDVHTPGTYSLIVADTKGCSTECEVTITLAQVGTPGSIQGPISVMANEVVSYSIEPVPGATSYQWTLPQGWTGETTGLVINVTADATNSTDALCVQAFVGACAGPDACIEVSFSTGVNDLDHSQWFDVQPNPSHGAFQIFPTGTNSASLEIMVYDAIGKLVVAPVTLNGTQSTVLHMESEASGAYFLRAKMGHETRVFKLLIQ
ncbi:MAG: T9SS type A sorting domain-containing protein, partial [Flavobacteriales bacterium]